MAVRVPLVNYLRLEPVPHLIAHECTSCGARYFDARAGCANCFGDQFKDVDLPTEGVVRSFTIVAHAAPGVEVPFVASQVDLGGTVVAGNIVGVPADPDHVRLGMSVRLTTVALGRDGAGTEAFGYGFMPS